MIVDGSGANLDTLVLRFAPMDGLTINEAAQTTGWSARMLRYVERTGLVTPAPAFQRYLVQLTVTSLAAQAVGQSDDIQAVISGFDVTVK